MKISSAISGTALAVIVVVMLISVVSIYDTAYGTVPMLNIGSPNVQITGNGVTLAVNISAHNRGLAGTEIQIYNQTYDFQPSQTQSYIFSLPVNVSALYSLQWPVQNVSYSFEFPLSVVSYFFNSTVSVKESNITIPAPFCNFRILNVTNASGQSNLTKQISVEFVNYMPLPASVSKLHIESGGKQIGLIELPVLTSGKLYDLNGTFTPSTAASTVNLTFSAGSFSWTVENVKI